MNPIFVLQAAKSYHPSAVVDMLVRLADGSWTGVVDFTFSSLSDASFAFDIIHTGAFLDIPGVLVDSDSVYTVKVSDDVYRVTVEFSILGYVVVGIDQVDPVEKLTTDDAFTLTATVTNVPEGESEAVTWTTEDTDVVTVDGASGLVTIVGAGVATVVATSTYNELITDFITVVVT